MSTDAGPFLPSGESEPYRRLIHQVRDHSIIALDPVGVICTWSQGAEIATGWIEADAVGQHFSMFYAPDDRTSGLPERLLEQARDRGGVEYSGWRVRRDETSFWSESAITAITDDDGTLCGFADITRDRTVQHRFEQARDRTMTAFVHDFRNPIIAIAGFVKMLEHAPTHTQAKLIKRIEDLSRRLTGLAEEFMERSRSAHGVSTSRPEVLDAYEIMAESTASLPPRLGPDRVRLPQTSAKLVADRSSAVRIGQNLISNALKYSAADTPVVVEVATSGKWVTLSVVDQGRGIHPEDQKQIFDDYTRGRLAESDGGSGLGLASVRALVLRNGGRVWIDSELGVGTRVSVQLPGEGTEIG